MHQQVRRANFIVPAQQTKSDLAAFFHASMCSPVLKTLQQAIRNDHLVSWPGIDKINFEKFITDTLAIDTKGHLDHERKNLRPTKSNYLDFHDLYPSSHEMPIVPRR